MERTGLWDIKGSEGQIYAAFKNRSEEGISWDKVKLTLDSEVPWCLPWNVSSEGSIFQFSDAAIVIAHR